MRAEVITGNALDELKRLEAESVHCCVTSPPYWGLRDYGHEGQLGLERTPEEYVSKLVEILHGVKRVLRKDATLWVNLGDSYAGSSKGQGGVLNSPKQRSNAGSYFGSPIKQDYQIADCKPKDLVGVPWMVAFALRADGWYLRSDCIWSKPNPMPESVTDRPTKSHEYMFLLSKSERYFYDATAIAEDSIRSGDTQTFGGFKARTAQADEGDPRNGHRSDANSQWGKDYQTGATRNKRSVWTVATRPFPAAHFATFPPELIKPCILAGTSEKGCCAACGAPYKREVEKIAVESPASHRGSKFTNGKSAHGKHNLGQGERYEHGRTTGWLPTCKCEADIIPCTVLDPFTGSGTTGFVAGITNRNFIGIELNPEYAEMARNRISRAYGIPAEQPKRVRREMDTPLFNTPARDAGTSAIE